MRLFSSFGPRHVAGAILAAATTAAAAVFLPAVASAQAPTGPQHPGGTVQRPPEVCIQIYPPPPGCPGAPPQTPPSRPCILIYPPPPGCEPGQVQPRRPWSTPPFSYPGGPPPAQPVGRVIMAPSVYRTGGLVGVRFGDGGRGLLHAGYRCELALLEVLAPGGWVTASGAGADCATLTPALAAGGQYSFFLPAGQPPGTYRIMVRLVAPGGAAQTVYSEPFTVW